MQLKIETFKISIFQFFKNNLIYKLELTIMDLQAVLWVVWLSSTLVTHFDTILSQFSTTFSQISS